MPATIGTLLDQPSFGLELVVDTGDARGRIVTWVHSSDLPDPTPWLEPGQVLLTDGAQFSPENGRADPATYCERLVARGVVGLGFATDVIHPGIPTDLITACEQVGLPLLRVPAATPFMSMIRYVADVVADERNARQAWLLDAQRAVARAAVRSDGMREILRTLAQRLNTWVALYDATGALTHFPGVPPVPPGWGEAMDAAARRLLDRGTPAALRTVEPHLAALQTIGAAGRLGGVLAVGAATPFGTPEADLVDSVVALASIALEQQRAVAEARGRVRAGILELLESGAVRAADRAARAGWGPLPAPPLRIVGVRGPISGPGLFDDLELVATSSGGEVFFAERSPDVVIIAGSDHTAELAAIIDRHRLTAGMSTPVGWSDLDRGLEEALTTAREQGPAGLVSFEDRAAGGILTALLRGGGGLNAARTLEPLDRLPAEESQRLREAARVWLDAKTAWDPAARVLGVHRHTLKARIDRVGQLTGLDLDTFAGRAELWAALELHPEEP